jgi:hypothetical protein
MVLFRRKRFHAREGTHPQWRTIWIVDAHRDGKRFIVRTDEKLTAFLELERAIYEFAMDLIS